MVLINVVCGIIYNKGKIFIARRNLEKSLGGYWEFPGGKVEIGEKFENALIRELEEELGMKVIIRKYLGSNEHKYENFYVNLIAYECEFVSATFKMTDHDEYKWVDIDILLQANLAPADIPIINLISLK